MNRVLLLQGQFAKHARSLSIGDLERVAAKVETMTARDLRVFRTVVMGGHLFQKLTNEEELVCRQILRRWDESSWSEKQAVIETCRQLMDA